MARVKLGFGPLPVPSKILVARWIVINMTGNPHYPDPQPDLQVVTDAVDALELAAQRALRGGTDKTTVKQIATAVLDGLMSSLQDYVQVAGKGDPIIIETSGMEVQKGRTPSTLLTAVQGPEAGVGGNAGEISLNWDKLNGAVSYVIEMQTQSLMLNANRSQALSAGATEDTLVASHPISPEWIPIDTSTKTKLLVNGLITGQVYSFRMAGINAAGQGDYSIPVSSVAR